ncbi:MAG: hypothetical protein Q4E57_04125 [Eubacteriales bacterium]|nr:hypothetical protein [Eubacteriales bacterium]
MTLFTEGRLQAYERMMQDTGRNRRHEKPENSSGKRYSTEKQPVKKAPVKSGGSYGSISG